MIKIDSKVGHIAADYVNVGNNTPLLIITHGRNGNRNGASKKIAEYVTEYGISSLRFDLYGYGESAGKFEDISISNSKESWIGVLNYIKTNLKIHSKIIGFGTSFGGSGLLAAAQVIDDRVIDGLIFRSAIINYKKKTEKELGLQKINEWRESGFIPDGEGRLKYNYYADMANYTSINYQMLSRFKILYFHGVNDNKVNFDEVQEMQSKLSDNMQIIAYENSGHGIDKPEDFADLLQRTKRFILDNMLIK